MAFDEPDRGGEKLELIAQTVFDIPEIRKMQARFSARGKQDKKRGPRSALRDELDFEPRITAFARRRRGSAFRL